MAHRLFPLASFLGALLFSGCVIYTEPNDQNQGAPPPPPAPPHQGQPQGQPPGPPGGQPPGTTVSGKIPGGGVQNKPEPPPQAKNPGGEAGGLQHGNWLSKVKIGEIVVTVNGGTCEIAVDGKSQGVGSKASLKIGAGDHEVTCQPAGAAVQSQNVTVGNQEQVAVTFDLTDPSKNTKVSKPMKQGPPVGRPTPGQ